MPKAPNSLDEGEEKMMNQAGWPSTEQIEALKEFAVAHGRNWKSALREAWMTGNYEGIEPYGNTAAYLQQIRNTFGPSWLAKFRLDVDRKTGSMMWSVQEQANAKLNDLLLQKGQK
jgi:hypothetical protein